MIRDSRPDDAPAIAAIWNPVIRDTAITFWPTERTVDEISAIITRRQGSDRAHLVALDNARQVIGFASYDQFRGGPGYARSMEHTIQVAPGSRGSGIGRALIGAIEQHARERGHRLMIGGVTGSNAASIAFHARLGYAEWGRVPAAGWKFARFHDLVLMGKDLFA